LEKNTTNEVDWGNKESVPYFRKRNMCRRICGNPTQMWKKLAMLGLGFWSYIVGV
jgi:hypothetical protein